MKGDKCWIPLPRDAVQDATIWTRCRDPVFPTLLALYGHPDSVTWWGNKMSESVAKSGFV